MNIILLFILSFFSGSLMFSYWLGLLKGIDIRKVRDGNPGAFNLWHCAGPIFGMFGVILDFLKGFLPVFIITKNGLATGWELVFLCIAPILGHTFSPFLSFKGGKGIDVSFGVWTGISILRMSLILALINLFLFIIIKFILKKELSPENSSFLIISSFIIFSFYVILLKDIYLIVLSILNTCFLVFKHKKELLAIIEK